MVIRSSPPETTPNFVRTQISTSAHATASIVVSSTTAIKRSPSVARREVGESEPELRIGTTIPDCSSRCCPGGTFTPHQLQRRNFESTVLRQRGHSMGRLASVIAGAVSSRAIGAHIHRVIAERRIAAALEQPSLPARANSKLSGAPQRVALSAVRLTGGISDRLSMPAVSSAVSLPQHSVDLRACCYATDAQNIA